MTVQLASYIQSLTNEINPPGVIVDTNASNTDWLLHLQAAFYEVILEGFDYVRNNYTESNFAISPISPNGPDIPRDLVQLIIAYAALRVVRGRILNLRTQSRNKAGPVETEYEISASLYVTLYKDLLNRKTIWLRRLSDVGILPTVVFDTIRDQDWRMYDQEQFWVR